MSSEQILETQIDELSRVYVEIGRIAERSSLVEWAKVQPVSDLLAVSRYLSETEGDAK